MYQINKVIERKLITFKDETYDPSTFQIKNLITNKVEIEFEGLKNAVRYVSEKCVEYNWDKDLVAPEITGFDISRPVWIPQALVSCRRASYPR